MARQSHNERTVAEDCRSHLQVGFATLVHSRALNSSV